MFRLLTVAIKEKDNNLVIVFDDLRPNAQFAKENETLPIKTPDALMTIMGLVLASYPFFSEEMGLRTISQDKELPKEINNEIQKWIQQYLFYHTADSAARDHLLDKEVTKIACFEQAKEVPVSADQGKSSIFMQYDIGDNQVAMQNAYLLDSVEFVLPKVPHLALYFIHHIFDIFRHIFANSMLTFSIAKQSLKDFVIKKDENDYVIDTISSTFQQNLLCMVTIERIQKEMLDQSCAELCQTFMTHLATINMTNRDYDLVIEQVALMNKKMTEWQTIYYPKDVLMKRPEDVLFIPMRLETLFDKNQLASFFINHTELLPLRFSSFLAIMNQSLSRNSALDASEKKFIAHCINYLIKKALFSQVIGKKTCSGKEYDFNHAAWFLLIFAKFSLQNGIMFLTDLAKNPAYQLFYAEGKMYHDIYEKEVWHLFNALGLHFANDKVRDVIQFDTNSSQYLATCGVHWTSDHAEMIKENQLSQSQFTLFNNITAKQRITHDSDDTIESCGSIKMCVSV